jgi:hypothetical protein
VELQGEDLALGEGLALEDVAFGVLAAEDVYAEDVALGVLAPDDFLVVLVEYLVDPEGEEFSRVGHLLRNLEGTLEEDKKAQVRRAVAENPEALPQKHPVLRLATLQRSPTLPWSQSLPYLPWGRPTTA